MPIDAVKIPQDVQIEDKVIGPISLRQLLIIGIGGGFSYMMYTLVQRSLGYVNPPLTVILWTPAVIAAAFALVNINDLSLLRICFLLLEKTQKPSTRTWAPRSGISITFRRSAAVKKEEEAKKPQISNDHSTQEQIAELTRVVDSATIPAIEERPPQPRDMDAAIVSTAREEAEVTPQVTPTFKTPVDPQSISVDIPSPGGSSQTTFSDLSVFRDVLPPTSTWPS